MADNITISEGTSKGIKTDEVGTAHYQEIKLDMGEGGSSLPFTGTVPELTNLLGGTVTKVEGGTVGEIGTITGVGVVAAGTMGEVGTVTGVGVLADGTISELGTITGTIESVGTIQKVGTVDRITRGTLDKVGTIPGIGVVAAGSIVVTDGTIGDMDKLSGDFAELENQAAGEAMEDRLAALKAKLNKE